MPETDPRPEICRRDTPDVVVDGRCMYDREQPCVFLGCDRWRMTLDFRTYWDGAEIKEKPAGT